MKLSFTILIFMLSIATRGEVPPRFSLFEKQNCSYVKNYQFLTKLTKQEIEKKIVQTLGSSTIRRLDITCHKGSLNSIAFILNHKVRTHFQTLLIWIEQKKLKGIEVLEFHEPKRYKAPEKWVKHISGKTIDTLYQVDALSGATLTRQSTLKLLKQAFFLSK